MLGLKRRKKQEGWAVDIDDSKDETKGLSLLQRIGDNNKFWAASIIVVVLIAALLIVQSNRSVPDALESETQPGYSGKGVYNDAAHKKFATDFVTDKSYGTFITSARFIDQERFEMIAGRGVSADEIDFAARMAARLILSKFRQRIVVEVYDEDSAGKHFLANTAWNPEKGYIVKFNKSRFGKD
jgi:hypothetical protein